MRVVFDYRAALRERSGVGEYTHQLAAALLRARASQMATLDLTLFSSSWKDRFRAADDLQTASVVDRRVPVRLLNLAWHRLGWPRVESLVPGPVDVAHSLHPLLMPSRTAAQVITIYDLNFLTHPERTSAEIRRDYAPLARDHAHRADRIIVISRFTAEQVHQRLGVSPDRISLCPPGAPAWQPRSSPPRDGYVLFLGTLEPRKNLSVLLDAYQQLAARMKRLPRLVVAGKTTEHSGPWLERISRPPLASNVDYIGYVDPAKRRELYDGARLLVHPSFEEGFGMTVVEAMAAGVPVIASDRGALPEVVGDAGLLVDAEDASSLARAIERVLDDPAAAADFTMRGLQRVRLFSWDRTAHEVLRAYESALAHRSRREAA